MKITKAQLKQIIKEELKATLNEDDQMAKAQELAEVFAQSPEIMAAVKLATQEPEVLAALSGAGTVTEEIGIDPFAAVASVPLAAALASFPPIVALGLTGGLALAAVAFLVGAEAGKKDSEYVAGAAEYRK